MQLGNRYSVEDLVPHRGSMLLIDRIEEYGPDCLRAAVQIRAGSLFVGEQGAPAWVGIEYMAQTAAAFGGLDQVQRGETPSIGLLIGSRYYRCMVDTFPLGATLQVSAKIAMRDEQDFAAYECRIDMSGLEVANCVLKAYRPKDIRQWLPEPR